MKNFTSLFIILVVSSASLVATPNSTFAQCITTKESRENITTNVTNVSGNRTIPVSSNDLNVGYKNTSGSTLSINISFNGNNNTYSQDTIRLIGNFNVNIYKNNNILNKMVFVSTSNSNITFGDVDIANGSDIKFINYGVIKFQNNFTMVTNTIFINKTSSSVLTFSDNTNFSNNSNTTVLYSNGGIINFSDGFTLQGGNKFCLTGNTIINTTTITNNVTNAITVPTSFSACIKYTSSATLNNSLTNGPGTLNIAKASTASAASNNANWGTAKVQNNSAGCSTLLPVTLASFKAALSANKKILITWTTATEHNTRNFEVERSIDGVNFKSVGTVSAKVFSNESIQYNFSDEFSFVKTSYYYRLKMVDMDGSFFYSGVREINLNNATEAMQVFASVGAHQMQVTFPAVKKSAVIKVTDVLGRTLSQQVVAAGSTEVNISTNNLKQGSYFVVMNEEDRKQSVQVSL